MSARETAAPAAPAERRPGRRGRPVAAATAAMVVLLGVLGVLVGLTTPWSPLGARVPGGAVRPDPRLDFTAAEIARERAYHAAVHPPAYCSLGVGLLVAALLAFTPAGARLVRSCARLVGRGWVRQVSAGAVAVVVVARGCTVPFDAWAHAVDRRYDLSTQGWWAWGLDELKGTGLTLVIALPVLLLGFAVARRMPRWWWAPLAGIGAALVVGGSFVYPVVVEPLFNNFQPLPPSQLRTSLLGMARADDVDVSQVLVADASRRTTTLNAYVSGFGASRRIVIYDTLLAEPPDVIRLIVAHELGHAKENDVLHGTLEGAVGFAAGICALYLVVTWPALLRTAGTDAPPDPRSVALVLGAVTWLLFVAAPLQDLVSRHIEARADVHSLDLTGDTQTFVRAHRALAVRGLSTLDTDPVRYALFFDHPTEPERIALARDWALVHHRPVPPPLVPGGGVVSR